MFAVVRTGGKQYRVAPGDKIVVEKLAGNAGDKVTLGDVLLAGDGGSLKSTDGLTVAAEIVAQAKRSEEHTSELQSRRDLVCRLLLEKKKRSRTPSGPY